MARGVNAITEASRLAIELERMNAGMPLHERLPPPSQFVSRIHGEASSLSLPEQAMLVLDRHLVTPETTESVLEGLRAAVDRLYADGTFGEMNGRRITVGIKERETPYLAPYVTPEDNDYVRMLAGIVRERAGEPEYVYGTSVADENVLSMQGIQVFGIGPEGGNCHAANEWVSRKSCLDLAQTLRAFVESL